MAENSPFVDDNDLPVAERPLEGLDAIPAAMRERKNWAQATTLLGRGYHICPEDGELRTYVRTHATALDAYYRTWGGSLESRDGIYWLQPGPKRYFGDASLDRTAMISGMVLAQMSLDPVMIGEPVTAAMLLDRVERVLEGGQDAMLEEFAPSRRRRIENERQDVAMESATKALRTLSEMGFLSAEDGDENSWRIRGSIRRFAEPGIRAGGELGRITEALRESAAAARRLEEEIEENA